MMKEYESTLGRNGRMTIPVAIRRHLGLAAADKVLIVIRDDGHVELRRAPMTLESVRGSVPSLPNQSDDFEREIEAAMEERAAELVRRLREE